MSLSAEEEAQIIHALTTIDWTEDAYSAAISIIGAALKCSDAHARRVLEDIYIKKQLLRCESNTGVIHEPGQPFRTKWKWFQE
jgi:hypothetical protein